MVSLLLAAKDRQYNLNEIKYSFVAWYIHSHASLFSNLQTVETQKLSLGISSLLTLGLKATFYSTIYFIIIPSQKRTCTKQPYVY